MAAGAAAGAVKALAGTASKKLLPTFRKAFMQAIPEALTGGAMTTGLGLVMGQPADEAIAYGVSDALGSAATLGLLGKAGIQNGLVRNVANIATGIGTGQVLANTVFKDRYAQQALQGQGGQAVTNAQQQVQRAGVNGMTADDIAGKYMADTMFQQMQGAINGGMSQGDMVRMMNSMGPTYDMNAARANMAAIAGV